MRLNKFDSLIVKDIENDRKISTKEARKILSDIKKHENVYHLLNLQYQMLNERRVNNRGFVGFLKQLF